jgi:hypothetical protein
MTLYALGRTLHVAVGVVTLITFWTAALARKGSPRHRRAGRIYLLSLVGILATASLMLAARLRAGDYAIASFLTFITTFLGTSAWLAWSSIRKRRDVVLLTGPVYRLLASLNIAAGLLMIGLFVMVRVPLVLILSTVGLGLGSSMWRLVLRGPRDENWWLEQHMNAAVVNFGATHDTFLAVAVGSIFPVLRAPFPRAMVAVIVLSTAMALRIALGRRYLRRGPSRQESEPLALAG